MLCVTIAFAFLICHDETQVCAFNTSSHRIDRSRVCAALMCRTNRQFDMIFFR